MLSIFSLSDFGIGEWGVILFLVLLLFGPKRLPELARGLGRSLRQFQDGLKEVKDQLERPTTDLLADKEKTTQKQESGQNPK